MSLGPRISASLPEEGSGKGTDREEIWLGYHRHSHGWGSIIKVWGRSCNWNEYNLNLLTRNNWRASLAEET